MLSVSVVHGGSYARDLKDFWKIAEATAEQYGNTVDRSECRLVIHAHIAETRKEAIGQARVRAGKYQREYFEQTLGHPAAFDGPQDQIIDGMMERGAWCVGSPGDLVDYMHRLEESTVLVQATEWGTREQVLHSYELIARYVMPQFQGSVTSLIDSQRRSASIREELNVMREKAMTRAASDYESQRDPR